MFTRRKVHAMIGTMIAILITIGWMIGATIFVLAICNAAKP